MRTEMACKKLNGDFHVWLSAFRLLNAIDYLLCRSCGNEIVRASKLISVPSKVAHRQRNDTIHGVGEVLIQLFKNPQGKYFEVITSPSANVHTVDKAYSDDSWFPGYKWTISVCPRCGVHIGWVFDLEGAKSGSSLPKFVGLVFDNLLHQTHADNLIAIPKAYRS